MQKKWKVLIGVIVLAVLALGIGSGVAVAQKPGPVAEPAPQTDYGPGGCHGNGYGFDSVTLGRVAQLLGLTTEALQAQLDGGKTLAEIAQAQGVSLEALLDVILAPLQEHLAIDVKYGYLTQEQADQILSQTQTRLSTVITQQATPSATGIARRGTQQLPSNNGRGGYGGMMGSNSGMMGDNSGMTGGGMMGGGYGGMMGGNGGMMGGNGSMMGW